MHPWSYFRKVLPWPTPPRGLLCHNIHWLGGGDVLRLVFLCKVPCLCRTRALFYCARNNWCCSDPVSAPAQVKVGAVAVRFSMTRRGWPASSLTACLLSLPSHSALILWASPGRPAVASLSVMLRVCHTSLCRFNESTEASSRVHSCLLSVTDLGGNPAISSPLGYCHLVPRLSCRHVRLETLFRRAGSFCVISIVAQWRRGLLLVRARPHAYTQMHTGGERRSTYTH